MKRCAQCGRTVQDDSLAFCLYDGQPLEAVAAPVPPAPPPMASGAPFSGPQPSGVIPPGGYAPRPARSSPVGWIIGGIVALAILGLIGFSALKFLPSLAGGGNSQAAVMAAIQSADAAEAQANKSLDPSGLTQFYTGDALARVQADVTAMKTQGIYQDAHLDSSQVQAVAFDGAGKNAAVQMTETWSTTVYAQQSNQVVKPLSSQTIPQVVHLQHIGDVWVITQVDYTAPTAAPSPAPAGQ